MKQPPFTPREVTYLIAVGAVTVSALTILYLVLVVYP